MLQINVLTFSSFFFQSVKACFFTNKGIDFFPFTKKNEVGNLVGGFVNHMLEMMLSYPRGAAAQITTVHSVKSKRPGSKKC